MTKQPPLLGDIAASLDRLVADSGRSRSEVFEDWLDYCAAVLSVAPLMDTIREGIAKGQHLLFAIDNSAEFYETEGGSRILEAYSAANPQGTDIWPTAAEAFRDAFEAAMWVISQPTEDGRDFIAAHDLDLLGYLYQHYVFPDEPLRLTSYAFARQKVSQTIRDGASIAFALLDNGITNAEEEGKVDPFFLFMAKAAVAAAFRSVPFDYRDPQEYLVNSVIPGLQAYLQPMLLSDPACGSGILLLAAAQRFPTFAVEAGLICFCGHDIDPICVKMAHLNEVLYGLNGFFPAAVSGSAPPTSLMALTTEEVSRIPREYGDDFFEVVETAQRLPGDRLRLRQLAAQARVIFRQDNEGGSPAPVFMRLIAEEGDR